MTQEVQKKLNALVARVRKVRLWLMTLDVLRLAALCLGFVCVYIGAYAWLDHHIRFGEIGRIIAFVLLGAGVIFVIYRLTKSLLKHISCSRAANYIESKKSFDQQLVTAVEYYEKKDDYPYSEALAEQLVLQVDKQSKAFKFGTTVPKWLAYVFGSIIMFGLFVTAFYVQDNYVYFRSYFSRLVHPLASIEPLPATTLEAITADIVAEPGSEVRLAARIKGRVPEFGRLVLADAEPNDIGEKQQTVFNLEPDFDEEEEPQFEAVRSFEKPQRLKYRFEAGEGTSPWHNIDICNIPKIKSIRANVTLGNNRYIRPYTQLVKDYTLEVAEDSFVRLTVEATERLSQAIIKDLDGKTDTKKLQDTNAFSFNFIADRKGFIGFELSSADGISNKDIPALQVVVKPDEAPQFKLLCPEGDYLATNVASVPVTFEVSDDFGLESVAMSLEIPGKEPLVFTVPVDKGAKSKKFTYTLELDRENLSVGDSILFYAKATDVDTGSALTKHTAMSDVYFIEIRPYRQQWHQRKSMLPGSTGKQGLTGGGPGEVLEPLLNILEYTRAIVKKTWAIAARGRLSAEDKSRLDSINNDVRYCQEQVESIREVKFKKDAQSKAALDEVLGHYSTAGKYLQWHQASSAMVPEKNAYRGLRKFVLELEKKLRYPGSGSPPRSRDRIKMEEQVHLTRYEKERVEWELERLSQKLAALVAQQKRLEQEFENFLKEQLRAKRLWQETTDERSWIANEMPSEGRPCPNCGSTKPGGCPVCSKATVEGALKPAARVLGEQGRKKPGQGGKGSGAGRGSAATATDKMGMLQARQRALRSQVAQLKRQLEELPEISETAKTEARQAAQKHLDEALAQMNNFEEKLAQARYESETDDEKLEEALAALAEANDELNLAKDALEQQYSLTEEQMVAKKAAELAGELTEMADDFDKFANDVDREEMLKRLEQAKRALATMSEQLNEGQFQDLGKTGHLGQGGPGGARSGQYTGSGPYVNPGSPGVVSEGLARTARILARRFWSIAIKARKQQGQLIEEEPSDASFYELESEFFENAARFEPLTFTNGQDK